MKKTLLLLSAAAAFSLGSCSENKPAETTASTDMNMDTTPATTASMDYSPDAINSRADRMANDMATSMKFDEPTRLKVRDLYVARGQRMAELNQKYMTDTMGMAAARRDVYTSTDTDMRTVFTDPTQYSAYETSRANYMDDRYMDNTTMNSSSSSDNMTISDAEQMKIKGEDGSKLKVKADGDIKMKDADGNKAKMDADDGTVKMKPEDGDKAVIK